MAQIDVLREMIEDAHGAEDPQHAARVIIDRCIPTYATRTGGTLGLLASARGQGFAATKLTAALQGADDPSALADALIRAALALDAGAARLHLSDCVEALPAG